ncbi:MAG TPA: sigma-54 dependent transcriptional regulator [Pyrinomonadaceae bacterium]|jgi:two-component system nitrogen regulation response regulator GlnG
MSTVLVVDHSRREVERIEAIVRAEGLEAVACSHGAEAERLIESGADRFAAAMILWDVPGPPFGLELLTRCRQLRPPLPTVVMSGTLDAALAARAFALGARDFLEKPLDSERVKSCLRSLLAAQDPLSPLVASMRETMVGESPAFLSALKQVARVIPHPDMTVLLTGESGTGKELIARSIHRLGPRAGQPWAAVNVGEIPATLIESALFGHERGAYTGAVGRHVGYLEEAGRGTLFLDEIGDLELSLQGTLLRAIQEREFRRLNGHKPLPFEARIVSATNRDLAAAVRGGAFRRDLYHRLAGVTIHVPPLREREGDLDLLLKHFLRVHAGGDEARFARETLTILRSYPFPGNVRELDNLVRVAVLGRDGEDVLPRHLPLRSMGAFLGLGGEAAPPEAGARAPDDAAPSELTAEVESAMPDGWQRMPYREAMLHYERAFDRVYLLRLMERCRYNLTRAAAEAGIDAKTFRKRWKESGLRPLGAGENSDG